MGSIRTLRKMRDCTVRMTMSVGPDFGQCRKLADERHEHDEMREERPLDELTAPGRELLDRRALLQIRRQRVIECAWVVTGDACA